jgi:hypothetical protein
MFWNGILVAALILVADVVYLFWYFNWEHRHTAGMAYYGLPIERRRALKGRIRALSLPAKPALYVLAWMTRRSLKMPGFEFEGVAGPRTVSSPEIFARARAYRPRPEDVFVVTQMRCGTTWMQQIVYEIVNRGAGDLAATGRHLYAVSPWIDAVNSVSITDAPLVGERPTRLIKTHLPANLCPDNPDARYIYVARHPVSCFASLVDFNRSLLGPLLPPTATMVDWYCSDKMYWLSWPVHVDGWWRRSRAHENVLFVHFEDMKRNLVGVIDRVATFIGCVLTPDERARVAARCDFAYMKQHEEVFEMAPPTMFSAAGAEFMARGKTARYEDVTSNARQQILDYCRRILARSPYPADEFYPDIAAGRPPAPLMQ